MCRSSDSRRTLKYYAASSVDQASTVRSDLVFLLSSKTAKPDRFFQGYFFHGTDYVFGAGGFEAFGRAKGLNRVVREDGCYVQAEKQQGGDYRFSADYNGYKKLFYFWDDGFWLVSNSLPRIAAHMRQHGYPVRPDDSQVAAMAAEGTFYPSGRGSFFSQLTSFDTIIRGVRLVPADCALRIGASGVSLEPVIQHPPDDSYEHQLGKFISTWLGRLNTLVNEPALQISCDLTGGLDSRTVFALLLGAVHGYDPGISEQPQIRSGMGLMHRKDRAVATRLCEHFSMPLNRRLRKNPVWLNGKTSYGLWKDLSLGAYHPIYFPSALPSGDLVHLGGGGGESHRPFYSQFPGAPSAHSFVARRTRNIEMRSARPGFQAALQQAIDRITDGAPEYLDGMACHYRHFRNRFHAGRDPQYTVRFQPLGSKLLDGVTAVAGKSRFRDAQIHYDILYNLDPQLLDIPFDSWRKHPGSRVRRRLTSTPVCPLSSGTCFIGETHARPEDTRKGNKTASAIDCLREEFERTKSGFAADFLGKVYVARAERALRTAARNGKFSGPIQSKRVAVVMACALFDD
jgi:hypothetical protein